MVFEHRPPPRWRDPDLLEVELTYAFGRAYWGRGYATEAGQAMLAYGFDEMGIARIINDVSSENQRSVNLMRRLGFELQRNLHPKPFGEHSRTSAVIGILENPRRTK
jgi:RimJ/RimL family protein N-acetyltransferase